jgi:protein-S-isoprenylcysteine O-methyltransferase Ste14
MNIEGYLVLAFNFLLIGVLPIVFFKRDGTFNWRWIATALPFLLSIGSVTVVQFNLMPDFVLFTWPAPDYMRLGGVLLSLCSISLIMFTLGTHRIPIALWHQTNDQPQHIVTWGAYSLIRHPFYASFLLAFVAGGFYCPQIFTLVSFVYGAIALNLTAKREEKRLSQSQFADEYERYMARTGRFTPRFGR